MVSKSSTVNPVGPLAGVRIVEWAANYSVPCATMMLADQGADVVKVEAPAGDGTRHSSAHREGIKGLSAAFVSANRNKRSIVLDMKQPSAIDAFKELIKGADVFIQNFRPGVIEKFGLGYNDLKEIRSDLIVVSLSGFGTHGPYSKQRVWDPVVQAVSGMMSAQSDPVTGIPTQMKSAVADKVTALIVAQGITAALYHRSVTRKGQHVEIDMLSASLAFNWITAGHNQTWLGEGAKAGANLKELRLVYKTQDDKYICAVGISNPEWAALATAVGRPDLIDQTRFKEMSDRLKRSHEIIEELSPIFLRKPSHEWLKILRDHDAVCAPVNDFDVLHLDPQVVAMKLLYESEHPHAGPYRQVAHPINFRGTPVEYRHHAPMLGEHSEEILREVGIDDQKITELKKSGAMTQY